MRDLIFKNLTSIDKKRRVVSSSEMVDNQGVSSIVRRHFICIIKELNENPVRKPDSYLCIFKERNTNELRERFFFKLKGSIYAVYENKLFLILYMHSLKVDLAAVDPDLRDYRE